ncbi:MAG: protein-L-isoaspartate(D-aspartate) O-methyltransferase [Desulfotalea sp.]
MVREQLSLRNISNQSVLDAFLEVPRHLFVNEGQWDNAYGDFPLPIIEGQTISQPIVVARMTQALELKDDDVVLEIGTGSGYQAAILSRLCKQVYTVERLTTLLNSSRKVFDLLRYFNICSKMGDGTVGWNEFALYDAIIVTAGGPVIPNSLIEQLKVGGRMVIPVGDSRGEQSLKLIRKTDNGIEVEELQPVRFVDLIGQEGWS